MEKTLDEILATNLQRLKREGKIESAKALERDAKVSASTLGYMMGTKERIPTKKGAGSCTLASLHAVANALGLHPLDLITHHDDSKAALLIAFEKVGADMKGTAVSVVEALAPKKRELYT